MQRQHYSEDYNLKCVVSGHTWLNLYLCGKISECCLAPTAKPLCHIFQKGKMGPKTAQTITHLTKKKKKQPVVMYVKQWINIWEKISKRNLFKQPRGNLHGTQCGGRSCRSQPHQQRQTFTDWLGYSKFFKNLF